MYVFYIVFARLFLQPMSATHPELKKVRHVILVLVLQYTLYIIDTRRRHKDTKTNVCLCVHVSVSDKYVQYVTEE